jgi:hypothetical protein
MVFVITPSDILHFVVGLAAMLFIYSCMRSSNGRS